MKDCWKRKGMCEVGCGKPEKNGVGRMLPPCGRNLDPMAGGLATGAFFAAAPEAGCGGPCGSIGASTKESQKGKKRKVVG